jgi:DNA-binding CsgD family transcriptional regulator
MSQKELWDVLEQFKSSKNLDDLWGKMRENLSIYGVTSVFYGVTHSPQKLFIDGAEATMQYKTDHPAEYRDYFDERFDMNDDITAVHCLLYESNYIWHRDDKKYIPNSKQNQFLDESAEFGMGVGVTLPLRFGMGGGGGMGICNSGMTNKEFDLMWFEHGEHILSICRIFDEVARESCTRELFSLTEREIEVLHWLGGGSHIKVIAGKLGTSASTVEKQVREARRKLKSRNNEQAVLKAYSLGLISP